MSIKENAYGAILIVQETNFEIDNLYI